VSPGVTGEIEVAAAPEQVWEVVMDPQRLGQWVTTHAGLGDGTPKELRQGSAFKQELSLAGARFSVEWTVTECDRPRSVTWTGLGPGGSQAHVKYGLDPVDGQTRFEYENQFELPGGVLGRLAGRTVGDRVIRREAERSLKNLKRLLER
jgi:carbon monoxide dehydrogenase subunit G